MTNHESLEAVHTPYVYRKVWNNSINLAKNTNHHNNFAFCQTKGITLIALVVTIVVLLILAGVTINLLFSDTGLFGKPQEAKNTWENAEQSDINAIGELGDQVNDILNGISTGGGVTPEDPTKGPNGKSLVETATEIQKGSNLEAEDKYGNPVVVPKGFKVVVDETTNNATTVSEGGNGGFYIGRYEQGEGNVCKAGVDAYVDVTRDIAKMQAEAMYTDKEQYEVTSELISSYAWDTALNFICQNGQQNILITRLAVLLPLVLLGEVTVESVTVSQLVVATMPQSIPTPTFLSVSAFMCRTVAIIS